MQVTIVYHLYKNSKYLQESLDSIFGQTDKDFTIIFISDDPTKIVRDHFKNVELTNVVKNFKYINIYKNLGHSFSFNLALDYIETPYVYFASSSAVFKKDFIEVINKKIDKNKNLELLMINSIKKENDHKSKDIYSPLYKTLSHTYINKVFNVKFLKSNNISFHSFNHYNFLFDISVLIKLTKSDMIYEDIVEVKSFKNKFYNLYDLIRQCTILINTYSETDFFKNYQQDIEYQMIRLTLIFFIFNIYNNRSNNKQSTITAIEFAESWLKKHIPDWRANKILNSEENIDHKSFISYMKNFEFKLKPTIHNLEKIKKDILHNESK